MVCDESAAHMLPGGGSTVPITVSDEPGLAPTDLNSTGGQFSSLQFTLVELTGQFSENVLPMLRSRRAFAKFWTLSHRQR